MKSSTNLISKGPQSQRRPAGTRVGKVPAVERSSGNQVRKFVRRNSLRHRQRRAATEATLEELPLMMGGVPGPLAVSNKQSGWKSLLHDDQRRSFVSYCPAAFEMATLRKWWHQLSKKLPWERPRVGDTLLPRSAAWLTLSGCTCPYVYAGTRWPTTSMPPWLLAITDEVCRACGLMERPNACNANFYENEHQSVGWHSDDEPLFAATKRDALIISLSLGGARKFEVRPNGGSESQVKRIVLGDGDLLTMEGLTQKHFRHRLPRARGRSTPRINLTWRWIVNHSPECKQSVQQSIVRTERLLERCREVLQPKDAVACLASSAESLQKDAVACAAPSAESLPKDTLLSSQICNVVNKANFHYEPRMERMSASGARLCLSRCFTDPATCMCSPLQDEAKAERQLRPRLELEWSSQNRVDPNR